MALTLRFHHTCLFQDSHVMRNSRLRQLHALLNIASAESGFLVERASTFFLERVQNSPASGIGNGVQKTIKMESGGNHDHFFTMGL